MKILSNDPGIEESGDQKMAVGGDRKYLKHGSESAIRQVTFSTLS